jgi:hypothetical protein
MFSWNLAVKTLKSLQFGAGDTTDEPHFSNTICWWMSHFFDTPTPAQLLKWVHYRYPCHLFKHRLLMDEPLFLEWPENRLEMSLNHCAG